VQTNRIVVEYGTCSYPFATNGYEYGYMYGSVRITHTCIHQKLDTDTNQIKGKYNCESTKWIRYNTIHLNRNQNKYFQSH